MHSLPPLLLPGSANSVIGHGALQPVTQDTDPSVDSWQGDRAVAAAPGNAAHQLPDVAILTHQRSARVTLRMAKTKSI